MILLAFHPAFWLQFWMSVFAPVQKTAVILKFERPPKS